MNYRIFVEKKEDFRVETQNLMSDLQENIKLSSLEGIRVLNIYDIFNLSESDLEKLENSFNDLHLQVEETQNNFKNYLDEINNKSITEGNNLKLVVEGLETKLEEKQKEIVFLKKGFYTLGIAVILIVLFLLFKGM